jgi:3,4-dihydroxy-2-butanone 4-phosphate synthase
MPFDRIEDALAAMARGSMVLVVDDEDRENEGDIILAAEHATAESIAFMVRHTSGMLCVALPGEDLDRLELPSMVCLPKSSTTTVRWRAEKTLNPSHANIACPSFASPI